MAKKPPPGVQAARLRGDCAELAKLGQKGREKKKKQKKYREYKKMWEWWHTVAVPGNYHICPVD